VAQTFDEDIRGGLIPFAEREVENQLRAGFHRDKTIRVSVVRIVVFRDLLLLFADEAPNLIGLNILNRMNPEYAR